MRIPLRRGNGRSDALPVYRQIAEHVRRQVAEGRLRDGARLPPIRALARELGVNRDTVALAYESLVADGLAESTVGRGTFVRAPGAPVVRAPFEPALAAPIERLLEFERARPRYGAAARSVPLHALVPDPSLYPVPEFRRALSRALASEGAGLLVYGGPHGHPGLRETLATRLAAEHGMRASAEELVICQGASQGIALALRLFAEPGAAVAVEEPTYQNVLGALAGLGLRPVPIPMQDGAPDLAALEAVLARPDVRLFYTIPTFHNPLGTTMPTSHRRALLEVARAAGKPVVEDAFEADLRFRGRPVPPLAALDAAGVVVHLVSFSKSLFPGCRVGAIRAHGRALEGLLALRHASDLGGALVLQAALGEFLASGAYERHLGRLRRVLRGRCETLLDALERELPEGAQWTRPEGGYQVWVELPGGIDTRDLLADAMRAGLLFAPGDQFQHDGRASNALRLTYAQADEDAIRRGVAILGEVARARLAAGAAAATSGPAPV